VRLELDGIRAAARHLVDERVREAEAPVVRQPDLTDDQAAILLQSGPSGLFGLMEYHLQQAFERDFPAATTERPELASDRHPSRCHTSTSGSPARATAA
jgi:hypothetical protein